MLLQLCLMPATLTPVCVLLVALGSLALCCYLLLTITPACSRFVDCCFCLKHICLPAKTRWTLQQACDDSKTTLQLLRAQRSNNVCILEGIAKLCIITTLKRELHKCSFESCRSAAFAAVHARQLTGTALLALRTSNFDKELQGTVLQLHSPYPGGEEGLW